MEETELPEQSLLSSGSCEASGLLCIYPEHTLLLSPHSSWLILPTWKPAAHIFLGMLWDPPGWLVKGE